MKITPFENIEIANSKEKSLDHELSCDIPSPAYSPVHPKAKQNVANAYPKISGYRIPMKPKRTDENNENLSIDSSETEGKVQSLIHELSSEISSPAYSPIHPRAKQNVVNEFPKISGLKFPMKSKPTGEKNEKPGVYFDSSGSYTVLPRLPLISKEFFFRKTNRIKSFVYFQIRWQTEYQNLCVLDKFHQIKNDNFAN